MCEDHGLSHTRPLSVCAARSSSWTTFSEWGASHGEVVAGCPAGLRGRGGRAGGRRRMRGDVRQEGGADRRPEADSLLRIHTLPQEHP